MQRLIALKAERDINRWEQTRMRSPQFWKKYCRELEMMDIIPIVTKVTGYTLGQLRSHAQGARVKLKVNARQLFVLLCLEHTPYSFVQIGITLNRDHTSMLNLSNRERSDAFEKIWEEASKEIDIIKEKKFGAQIHEL